MASALKDYLTSIGGFEVLTAEEEKNLARTMEIGKSAEKDLVECEDPDQRSILYDLINEGQMAREELINHNLKLVVSIAKKYTNTHMELMDLINEGNLGLMTAVEKFNPELGWRFSTCATPWIKQAITKSIIDKGKTIRIPAHIYQLLSKFRQALEELGKDGHDPSVDELATYLNITTDKVQELYEWRQDTISLETPLGTEDEDNLLDIQADPNTEETLQYVERKSEEEHIQQMLSTLKPRTQQIMKMRFGLGKENDPISWREEHTLEEVGLAVGLTRERVRQIIKETLKTLKEQW